MQDHTNWLKKHAMVKIHANLIHQIMCMEILVEVLSSTFPLNTNVWLNKVRFENK